MKMSKDDAKKYPDLHVYIKHHLPNLPYDKPKIYNAFKKYSAKKNDLLFWHLASPLRYDMYPELRVDTDRTKCEDDGLQVSGAVIVQKQTVRFYGMTVPFKGVERILVAQDLALGALATDVGVILEATILHELVHWCRKIAGKDVYDEGPPHDFEREAYGDVQHRTWESCPSVTVPAIWMNPLM